jgi:hypothetical protein
MLNQNLLLTGDAGYNLTNSLRFRSSASAYLNRTPASTSSRTTWTWSGWVKLGRDPDGFFALFGADANGYPCSGIALTNYNIQYFSYTHPVYDWQKISTMVLRDHSAWYHIVAVTDTTNGTAEDRARVYVNGQRVTSWSTNNNPSPSFAGYVNSSSYVTKVGRVAGFGYFDGYMSEVNFIDGLALDPSSFGETSTSTGVWIPKKYVGSYGTNGFYLDFEDNSSTAALGYDAAGSNDFTVNNISLTTGATYDSMTDVPTLTSATTANYCVLNPLDKGGTVNPKNGNLGFANTAGTYSTVRSTVGITSGKWYFEYTIVNSASIGGGSTSAGLVRYDSVLAGKYLGQDTNTLGGVASGTPSLLLYNGTNKALSSGLNSFSVGAVIQYAYDADAGKLWVGVNNSWDGGNDPSTGSTPTLSSGFAGSSGPWFFAANGLTSPDDVAVNFGQQPFAYTPPTGFVALNTFNLPTPTIGATASTTANKYMDATLYTGNSSTQTVANSGSMQPDFVWIKDRSAVSQHVLTDSVRGVDRQLFSSLPNAEQTSATAITSFNSNGFTTGANPSPTGATNSSPDAFVAWQWRASNATAVTNTAGSITSTVSASTTAGFSVVTYTGVGGSGTTTVGHGLNVSPSMVIIKRRNSTADWATYHTGLTSTSYYLFLNSTAGQANYGSTFISPSSSTLTIDAGSSLLNTSTGTYVAYCFAPVSGYSAFGSYTGNGDPNGAFVYLGFRPKFVLIKSTASGTNWVLHDSSREPFNEMGTNSIGYALNPENNVAESTNANLWAIDFTSNGFKNRSSSASVNSSGQTYIYMAFAENPFKYANAR